MIMGAIGNAIIDMVRIKMEKPKMIDYLPEYEDDEIQIVKFTLNESFVTLMKLRDELSNRNENDSLEAGDYIKLSIKEPFMQLQMSDTAMEWDTNQEFIKKAKGDILIGGLGIGFILIPIVNNPKVKSITVIEENKNIATKVYEFLKPHLNDKVKVICASVEDYIPDMEYDVIYMDIWPTICGDNYDEMVNLKRQYHRYLKEDGWFGCWCEVDCMRLSHSVCPICNEHEDECVCEICQECYDKTDELHSKNGILLCPDCFEAYWEDKEYNFGGDEND
jgi:hypothetical protein